MSRNVLSSPASTTETSPPAPLKGLEELVAQTVTKLLSYRQDPFIKAYLEAEGIPKGTPNTVLAALLPNELLGKSTKFNLSLERLADYLDKLQETGRQTAFLFTVPANDRVALLAQLRDPAFLDARLHACGFAGRRNRETRIWSAVPPELAIARHDADRLVLKWVGTRTWHKAVGSLPGRQFIKENERAVSFVRFDLSTGEGEIILQPLQTFPERSLAAELDLAKALTMHLLGFDPFGAVSLEPAIRRALEGGEVDLTAWSVQRCGAGGTGELAWHGLPRKHTGPPEGIDVYTGLTATWEEPFRRGNSTLKISVTLDARDGSIELHQPCLPEEHSASLARIRLWLYEITDPDLRGAALARREDARVIALVDARIDARDRRIDGAELAREEGGSLEAVEQAFESIRAQNPQRFELVHEKAPESAGTPVVMVPFLLMPPQGWLYRPFRKARVIYEPLVRGGIDLALAAGFISLIVFGSRPLLSLLQDVFLVQATALVALLGIFVITLAFLIRLAGRDEVQAAADIAGDLFGKVTALFG